MPTRPIIVATDTEHLRKLISREMWEHGNQCDLNHIDVSQLASFSALFRDSDFNGNVSQWDMSNATDIAEMFHCSKFNGDVSQWNTGNVVKAGSLFELSPFSGDVSNWNMSKLRTGMSMFCDTNFNGDVSRWNTSELRNASHMFERTPFNGDVSNWRMDNVRNFSRMFAQSPFAGDLSRWHVQKGAHLESMVDANFKGSLPRPVDSVGSFSRYAQMFKDESEFELYLAQSAFNAAHANVLCASAIRPPWFSKGDYAWFKDITGMACSIGLDMNDLPMHVLAQYQARQVPAARTESWHVDADVLSNE